jgi:hypothetical protein
MQLIGYRFAQPILRALAEPSEISAFIAAKCNPKGKYHNAAYHYRHSHRLFYHHERNGNRLHRVATDACLL